MLEGHLGAPQFVLRYSRVDLDDAGRDGGAYRKVHVGMNWCATRRRKAGMGRGTYLAGSLPPGGMTNGLLKRLEWMFWIFASWCFPAICRNHQSAKKLLISLDFSRQAITLDGLRERKVPAIAGIQGTSKT